MSRQSRGKVILVYCAGVLTPILLRYAILWVRYLADRADDAYWNKVLDRCASYIDEVVVDEPTI
jgi:hypothetical protein